MGFLRCTSPYVSLPVVSFKMDAYLQKGHALRRPIGIPTVKHAVLPFLKRPLIAAVNI